MIGLLIGPVFIFFAVVGGLVATDRRAERSDRVIGAVFAALAVAGLVLSLVLDVP